MDEGILIVPEDSNEPCSKIKLISVQVFVMEIQISSALSVK
jgi:hypothetical protein